MPITKSDFDPILFIRYPILLNSSNQKYLKNCNEAVDAFNKWFKSKRTSYESYKTNLKEIHRTILVGKNFDSTYRKNLKSIQKNNPLFQFRNHSKVRYAKLKSRRLSQEKIAEIFGVPKRDKMIVMPKLPKKSWPFSAADGNHIYPESKYVKNYLKQMYALIKKIKNNPKSKKNIDLISTYYFYAINARPFSLGNNSIFMLQVNCLLKEMDHSGTPHYYIDHMAHRMQMKEFNKFFKNICYPNSKFSKLNKKIINRIIKSESNNKTKMNPVFSDLRKYFKLAETFKYRLVSGKEMLITNRELDSRFLKFFKRINTKIDFKNPNIRRIVIMKDKNTKKFKHLNISDDYKFVIIKKKWFFIGICDTKRNFNKGVIQAFSFFPRITEEKLALHASCVAIKGNSFLFAGDNCAGKSTIAYYFEKKKFEIIDDDTSVLKYSSKGFVVKPKGNLIKLRNSSFSKKIISSEDNFASINNELIQLVKRTPRKNRLKKIYLLRKSKSKTSLEKCNNIPDTFFKGRVSEVLKKKLIKEIPIKILRLNYSDITPLIKDMKK